MTKREKADRLMEEYVHLYKGVKHLEKERLEVDCVLQGMLSMASATGIFDYEVERCILTM